MEHTPINVTGFQKLYSKSESGANLYCSMMFIDLLVDDGYFLTGSKFLEYISTIRIIHNYTRNKQTNASE
jgi:hypothetical protein